MAVVLDHLFICTLPGAPEAEQLVALGLAEASRSLHRGQGTSLRLTLLHGLPVSSVLHTLAQLGIASFSRGPGHLAEVVLDEGAQGQRVDFQPALPLIMCY